jgi:hypothetical protein
MAKKNKQKLSKAQVLIASQALAGMFQGLYDRKPKDQLKAATVEAAEALVAGMRVISQASRSKP